jgi:thimet oligopeptidase
MSDERWVSWGVDDINAATEAALSARHERLEAVLAVPAEGRTFANTIVALERVDWELNDLHNRLQLLMAAHPDALARNASQAAFDRISDDSNEVAHDHRIWDAVSAYEKRKTRNEKLDTADAKLLSDTVRDLKRVGFHLPADAFAMLKANRAELAKLESAFEKAINDWSDEIVVTEPQLDGLPDHYRDGLARTEDGKYRVTLAYPDLFPFLRHAHDDAARRELAHKYLRRGGDENMTRLADIIRIRQENARLLGYPTHADYVTEPRMAKSQAEVSAFLEGIIEKLMPAQRAELRDLIRFKKEVLKLEHPAPLLHHELMYWSERLRKSRFALDSEVLKQYFPLERVREGMFGIYEELFGVRFSALHETAWHSEVTCWQVTDDATNAPLGRFYLDLHPREGKYGHAAAFPLSLGREDEVGSIALVCNFPKPTPSNPSLMDHGEVETLLHEFGHLMHGLLSAGKYPSQNGLAVAMDFVEAPSQMLEEWAWDAGALARLSGHPTTGKPVPADLLTKLLAARRFLQASDYLGQAVMALYDLRLHSQPTDTSVSGAHLAQMHRDMKLQYEAVDLPDDAIKAAGWSHMADYDAAYYGYLWSKVYALDMFTRFAANPLDASVGRAYRSAVLARGASADERVMVRDFLGREPSDGAFLSALGIE